LRLVRYTTTDLFVFQQIRFLGLQRGLELNLVTGADEMFICGFVWPASACSCLLSHFCSPLQDAHTHTHTHTHTHIRAYNGAIADA
jgi:hypothetical protein